MAKGKIITKADALDICNSCTKRNSNECVYSDIEGSRKETISMPKCMSKFEHNVVHPREKVRTPTRESSYTHESSYTQNNSSHKDSTKVKQGYEESCTPQGVQPKSSKNKLDDMNSKIIELLKDQWHCRGIAKELNAPHSTISYRLNKLQKAGLIKSYNGAYGTKLYKLSSHLDTPSDQSLIHDDNRQQSAQSFNAHCMTYSFPIVTGSQPKSKNPYHMKNWTGYIFYGNNYKIRSTPRSIIIDINQDLGAGTIDDLIIMYTEMAKGHLVEFTKQHKITLGTPKRYRKPHFLIPDTAIGKALSQIGSFETSGGISVDESQSKGDLEMGEDLARDFEYTLNKLPKIVSNIENNLGELNKTGTDRFDKVDAGITNLHILTQMQHENNKMREDLTATMKVAQEQLEIIKTFQQPEQPDEMRNKKQLMELYG